MFAGARLDPRSWSLASQLFAIQSVVALVVLVGVGLVGYSQASSFNTRAVSDEVLGIARSVAATPTVLGALDDPDPSVTLQPFAERVRRDTATDFVVVMSVTGTRYSHPTPARIGGEFLGHIEPAARGEAFTETFTGTLGPSVRAVVPVMKDGHVRALVAAGIRVSTVSQQLVQQLPLLLGATVLALVVAGLGSWLASRWLRRTTQDLGPAELGRMYEFYDAVLHSVREGLLLLDRNARLALVNDEARRLLDLPEQVSGRRIDEVGLPSTLGEALATGQNRTDEIHLTPERVLLVSQARARWAGNYLGSVITLRDHTELRALVSELRTVRGFADSLHAQAHETANHLHTIISLIELGRPQQAMRFATTELSTAQQLTDLVIGSVEEPELAALLLGKTAQASQRGVELMIAKDVSVRAGIADPRDLVTILGNLIDNALDAVSRISPPRRIEVSARCDETEQMLRVADNGPGLDPSHVPHAFKPGWSTKDGGHAPRRGLGLALVDRAARRYGGSVEVANQGGAVFTVLLPCRPAVQHEPPARDFREPTLAVTPPVV